MNPDEVLTRLTELKEEALQGGQEEAHIEADALLCEFLDSLGYYKISEEFCKIDKWYA